MYILLPNAKYRCKQIKVHLSLPVEKMGHLYRVIKQHATYIFTDFLLFADKK
jgi:hypothetical protein